MDDAFQGPMAKKFRKRFLQVKEDKIIANLLRKHNAKHPEEDNLAKANTFYGVTQQALHGRAKKESKKQLIPLPRAIDKNRLSQSLKKRFPGLNDILGKA